MATPQTVSLEAGEFAVMIAANEWIAKKNDELFKENNLLKKVVAVFKEDFTKKEFLVNKIAFLENEKSVLKKEILKREKVENAMMEIARRKGRNGICDLMLPIHYREGEWGEDTEDGGLDEYTATSSDDE